MNLRCPQLSSVRAKVLALEALLPATGAAACGGGPGTGKPRKTELAFLERSLKDVMAKVLTAEADTPEQQALAARMVTTFRSAPQDQGSEHGFLRPKFATGRPGVVTRAVEAMEEYRNPGFTFLTKEQKAAGMERRRVEFFPKKEQKARRDDEVAVFGEELASDLERARRWVREFVETPEAQKGKRWETGPGERDEGKTAAEVANRLERILGIERGQKGAYTEEMRAAALKLLPHIQAFVDHYDPDRVSREQGIPPEEVLQPQPGDARTRAAQPLTPADRNRWEALVFSAWRASLRANVPPLFGRRFKGALEEVGWGKVAGSKGRQGGLGL